MKTRARKRKKLGSRIAGLLCPVLVLASANTMGGLDRNPAPRGEGNDRAVERGAIEEGRGSHLVLRDVLVSERPRMVSSSGRFRLEGMMVEIVGGTAGIEEARSRPSLMSEPAPPTVFSLSQNYPNPFNPSTTIAFSVPEDGSGRTSLGIYDVRGRLVRVLVDEDMPPGNYRVHWDGKTDREETISSGVYLYRLERGGKILVRKMTVAR